MHDEFGPPWMEIGLHAVIAKSNGHQTLRRGYETKCSPSTARVAAEGTRAFEDSSFAIESSDRSKHRIGVLKTRSEERVSSVAIWSDVELWQRLCRSGHGLAPELARP